MRVCRLVGMSWWWCLGILNVRVRHEVIEGMVGQYGVPERNESDERFKKTHFFCFASLPTPIIIHPLYSPQTVIHPPQTVFQLT